MGRTSQPMVERKFTWQLVRVPVSFYKQGLMKYPDSDVGHYGLGETYLALEQFSTRNSANPWVFLAFITEVLDESVGEIGQLKYQAGKILSKTDQNHPF